MQQHEIEKKVYSVIVNQFDVKEDDITPDWSLKDDLGADSGALVELMINLEEVFEREMPEMSASQVTTVGDVVKFIREGMSSKPGKG